MKKPVENKLFKVRDEFDRLYIQRTSEMEFWVTNGHWAVKSHLGGVSAERGVTIRSIPIGKSINLANGQPVEIDINSVIPPDLGQEVQITEDLKQTFGENRSPTKRQLRSDTVSTQVNEDYLQLVVDALEGYDKLTASDANRPVVFQKDSVIVALIMPMRS